MRIGLLGAPLSPELSNTLEAFRAENLAPDAIFMDEKAFSSRQLEIWNERTRGELPHRPLSEFEEMRIATYNVRSHASELTENLVRELDIDLLVNAGSPRILPKALIESASIGVLNVHPGILPWFRGCTCVEWAVFRDEELGNTAHLMNEKIDEGPILRIEKYQFSKSDDYTSIRTKMYRAGYKLLARVAKELKQGQISLADLKPQAEGNYYKPMDPQNLEQVKAKLSAGQYRYQVEATA